MKTNKKCLMIDASQKRKHKHKKRVEIDATLKERRLNIYFQELYHKIDDIHHA